MSAKSHLPSDQGQSDVEVTPPGPSTELEEQPHGNAAAQAAMECSTEPADEGGSWWDVVKSSVGLGTDEGDPVAEAQCMLQASNDEKLAKLNEWLTDGWLDAVSSRETEAAKLLLDSMDADGKERFANLNGGALADQLIDNPDGDSWWSDPLGAIAGDTVQALEDAKETLKNAGDAVQSYRDGDEALEVAQAASGGDLGGMVLDTSGDHSVEMDGELSSGTLTLDMAELKVESFEANVGDTSLKTGPGLAKGLKITLDSPDKNSPVAQVSAEVESLDWKQIELEQPALSVVIPNLVMAVLKLAAMQSEIDRDQPTTAVQDMLSQAFMYMGLDLAPALAEAARTARDAAALADGIADASGTSSYGYSLSFDSFVLPAGATMEQRTTEGTTTTEVGAMEIKSFALTLEQVDRLSMLEGERKSLAGSGDMVDKKRLEWLDAEILRVHKIAVRKKALDAKKQAGGLSPEEEDEWVAAERDLMAGVMNVETGVVSMKSVSQNGESVDDIELEGISGSVSGKALASAGRDTGRTSDERGEAVQGLLDKSSGRDDGIPEPAKDGPMWGDLGDLQAKGEIKKASTGAAGGSAGGVDSASATGLKVNASGQYLGVKADSLEAKGIAAQDGSADSLGVGDLDVVVRGNDIGGRAGSVEADGMAYEKDGTRVDVAGANAEGLSFDIDGKGQRLRSGSADHAEASGIAYDDGSQSVHLSNISGQGLEAKEASSAGVGQLDADRVDLGVLDYESDGTTAHMGGASLEGVSGTDLSASGTGALSVDSVQAEDLSGSMAGTGSGGVDELTAEGLKVVKDEQGTVATVDGAHLEGANGTYGDLATGSAQTVDVGRSGVALGADNSLQGASIEGLDVSGIDVKLLTMPMNEVTPDGEKGPSEDFIADSLAAASGQFSSEIPLMNGGYVAVSGRAVDGRVPIGDLQVSIEEAGVLKGWLGGLSAMIQVDEGRGLTVGFGPFSLKVLLDERETDGLISKREGGGKKGSIALEPFIESMMNGKMESTIDEEAVKEELSRRDSRRERRRERRLARRDRRDERREVRNGPEEEVEYESTQAMIDAYIEDYANFGYGFDLDITGTRVDMSGLKLGDGALGYESMQATLDDGGNAQANQFTIRGNLGTELSVGASELAASSLSAVDGDGNPVNLASVGVKGLAVTIDKPLSVDRSIEVDVDNLTVRSIRYGDTSRLDKAPEVS